MAPPSPRTDSSCSTTCPGSQSSAGRCSAEGSATGTAQQTRASAPRASGNRLPGTRAAQLIAVTVVRVVRAERAVEGPDETLLFIVGFAVLLVVFWRLLPSGLSDVQGKLGPRAFVYYRWFLYATLTFITAFFLLGVVAAAATYLG
jgi:hypothetical protein